MTDAVMINGVVLEGADLTPVNSPWGSVRRANNRRLIPIALGVVAAIWAIGFDGGGALSIVGAPLLLLCGWYGFIWLTQTYLGAYKKAYALTPTGSAPCDFYFDGWGMKQIGAGFKTEFEWRCLADVTEDRGAFRFWLTPFSAVVLPYRYASEGKDVALRQLIADARARGEIVGVEPQRH